MYYVTSNGIPVTRKDGTPYAFRFSSFSNLAKNLNRSIEEDSRNEQPANKTEKIKNKNPGMMSAHDYSKTALTAERVSLS